MTAEQPNRGRVEWVRQLALALDLPFLLISAVMGGGIVGYLLDEYLHTSPWLMLICGGLGFAAGLRAVLQSLARRTGKPGAGGGTGEKRKPGGNGEP